jgi:YHS domain-containing protein
MILALGDVCLTATVETVHDVVCGKTVHSQVTPWQMQHGDATYYFCSLSCALQFKAAPDTFAAAAAAAAPRKTGDKNEG